MQTPFGGIYKGKRVFITGHTGFKGSWLALWLQQLGAEVLGYSIDIPTNPSHWELLKLNIPSTMGDILDREKLQKAMTDFQPDAVFHLAAQPLVRESYEQPVKTFETNVLGTVNVLEACRQLRTVKAIINITSDKCYENKEWARAYHEGDPLGGHDPYSASKGAAEIVANAYRTSFFQNDRYGHVHTTLLADVRAGNVIGGGDWAKDRLIPDIMKATSRGETVVIRNPDATRPWQHVLDPLSGYLQLGWHLLGGETAFAQNWNFGPNEESHLTVQQIVERAQQHWESIHYAVEKQPFELHEAKLLTLDSTKARTQLRWQSVWDIGKSFEKTIQWYRGYYEHGAVNSLDDLRTYLEDARDLQLEWMTL